MTLVVWRSPEVSGIVLEAVGPTLRFEGEKGGDEAGERRYPEQMFGLTGVSRSSGTTLSMWANTDPGRCVGLSLYLMCIRNSQVGRTWVCPQLEVNDATTFFISFSLFLGLACFVFKH